MADTIMNGLILAGGFSTRMGMDKSTIDYHGVPQYKFVRDLLSPYVQEVFISCRPGQEFEEGLARIEDQYMDIGPLAGILSAFQVKPDVSWLMLACDLPYVDHGTLSYLVSRRDSTKQATFFIDPDTQFPEPMLAIFEPSIYPVLVASLQSGQTSLNKILQASDNQKVLAPDPLVLKSINTKEEMEMAKHTLNHFGKI
ncbi:MAG TPA: NTP transferase domain-containing protein [Saprospiraceae bacterium]|nr:NTP transferase domain-containing protein [Saprospiraceae bacterium]